MKNLLILIAVFLPLALSSQAIVKGSGIVYTNGAPTHTVTVGTDAEFALDTTSGLWYEWGRDCNCWVLAGFRIQKLAGSSPPSGAPADKESEIQINDADSLYRWRAGDWHHINKVLVYTAGTGINVTGTTITNTGDLSATNEGILGVGAGSGTSSVLLSNTSGATGVTINAAGILAITESTSSNGGSITLTATEVDGSTSNELQTIANTSDATSHTVTLSNSGGSVQLVEGSNITLTTSGSGSAGIVTIAATGGSGSTDLSVTGTSSPVTLNSSTGTDVTFTQGGIVTITATSGNITVSATEVDGSTTNEIQTYSHSGTTTYTNTLSNSGGSWSITGAGIAVISQTGGAVTVTATEVDGSTTNELQTIANTSDATSHTVTLSNSGGSIQLVEGANVTLTTSGTGSAGIVTIAATSGGGTDLSVTGTSSPVTLNSSTGTDVTFTQGGIVTITATSGNITVSATEVDGSTTNEIQTYSHAGTTTYTNTLSSGGGSWSITGAGIAVISQTAGAVTVTATEVDGSVTNEGILGVGAGSGTSSVLLSNTSGATGVTINAAGILAITESTSSNGGSITLTATEVDGSTSNELQTLANTSDATSHTVTLSSSGGSIQLVEGANVTLTTSGTGSDGIVTIAATSGGGTDLSVTGTSSPVTLNSSTGTDVTFTQGGIVTITATSGNITVSATEVDGSTTNEIQTYSHSGTTTYTNTLSNGGGSWSITGAGIAVISQTGGAVTVTATEVDGSTTNEIQTYSHSGTTTYTNTLSNSGGSWSITGAGIAVISQTAGAVTVTATEVDGSVSNEGTLGVGAGSGTSSVLLSNTSGATGVTINAAGILAITESTSSNGGSITLTATEVDGSTTNEIQTYSHSGTTTYTNTLSNSGGSWSITGAGIAVISQTAGAVTVTATEVDGSTTNELQTIANTSDATSHTVTLSNSGGSVQLVEGSNITLTTSGTGSAGIVTIAATGGGSTDLSVTGTSSPVTLNSSTGTDVTFTQGGIVTITATSGNITVSATEVDGSTTNELQTYSHSGTTTYTNTLSNSGGSWSITGAGIAVISQTAGAVTVTATEVDGSTTNELQTIANTSDATSHTVTLSSSGGSVQLVEGTNITLTTTGTSSAGVVTIAATGGSSPSVITPSQITSTQNDYSPTGWADATFIRISGDGSFRQITGLAAETSGEQKTFKNVGTTCLYFSPEHTGSSASNRISHYEEIVMTPNSVVTFIYDGTLSRWTVLQNTNEGFRTPNKGSIYDVWAGKFPSGLQENEYVQYSGSGNFSQVAPSSTIPFTYWSIDNGTGATNDGSLYLMKQTDAVSYFGSTFAYTKSTFRSPSALSSGTQRYRVRCVITASPSSLLTNVNNTLGIRYSDDINSGKFQLYSRNSAGSETTADSGVTFAVNTEYTTAISYNYAASEATFYINGSVVGRITATLPSAAVWGAGIQFGKLVGTGTVTFYVNRVMAAAIKP